MFPRGPQEFLYRDPDFAAQLAQEGITLFHSLAAIERDTVAHPHRQALARILVDKRFVGIDPEGTLTIVCPASAQSPHERAFTDFCNGQIIQGVQMPCIHPAFKNAPHLVTFFEKGSYTTECYADTDSTFTTIAAAHTAFQEAAHRYAKHQSIEPSSAEATQWTLSRTVGWPAKNLRHERSFSTLSACINIGRELVPYARAGNQTIGWAHDDIHGDRCVWINGTLHFTHLKLHTRPLANCYDLLRAWGHMLLFSANPGQLAATISAKVATLCSQNPEHARGIRALWRMRCSGMMSDIYRHPERRTDDKFLRVLKVFKQIVEDQLS